VQKEPAEIPVIAYVSPEGRALRRPGLISEAADVLAMSPATNIGSSTPIQGTGSNIGSDRGARS
jgi:membrane-bound ClpP family serine protease